MGFTTEGVLFWRNWGHFFGGKNEGFRALFKELRFPQRERRIWGIFWGLGKTYLPGTPKGFIWPKGGIF